MSKTKRTKAEQAELLRKPLSDFEENPVVKDLISEEFIHAPDLKALDVTTALAELIRGQQFISEELIKMRTRMAEYDETTRKFEEDREKFMQEVLEKAEKLKDPSGRTTAQGALQYEREIERARAEQANSRLVFEDSLRRMPKETITVMGIPETLSRTGEQVIMPEIIRIKHKQWVIQPGVPTEVPQIVADRYRQMLRGRQEMAERKALLSAQLKDTELSRRLRELDEKYKSGGDSLPIGSTA